MRVYVVSYEVFSGGAASFAYREFKQKSRADQFAAKVRGFVSACEKFKPILGGF